MSKEDFKGNIFVDIKNKSGTYHIFNLVNKKMYIGSAKNLYKRMGEHYNLLVRNKHYNKHLQNAWNKYGEDNFKFFVNGFVEDDNDLLKEEQFRIDFFLQNKPGFLYNINPLAGSLLGFKHSEETRKKMSENNGRYNLGKPMPEETKRKISETLKEKNISRDLYGEKNPSSKLTEEDVIKIKIRILTGENLSKIGDDFGIKQPQVSRIKLGRCWDWVKIPDEYLYEQVGGL